ncbi:AraC family transcriptional regulator [Fictibacillus fluitans]|uniref:AraC family transcriptional regulator n=1 Tax=Fictibacillus fluitans TaxID=3058422 RepID=A0ABT8HQD0_9BACL|nr:AraC family transcriptional regulator [Fictibacillus sp. NE201]MDN4522975.1 AraC family transcriptional regulator [Fictibacillus sp. NE201]
MKLASETFFNNSAFSFSIFPYTFKSNESIHLHYHEFFELGYVMNGTGYHLYMDNIYPIKQGDVLLIEPGKLHGYQSDKTDPLYVCNVLFQLPFLKDIADIQRNLSCFSNPGFAPLLGDRENINERLALTGLEHLEISLLIKKMMNEYQGKEAEYQLLIKAKFIELFTLLRRSTRSHEVDVRSTEVKWMEEVCSYINMYYNDPLSLDKMSKVAGMSKSNFTSKFKQTIGKTFVEYRNEIRIKASCDLLRETDMKIINIANEVGFDDISHFIRTFKQLTRVTPSEYRKKHSQVWLN